MVDLPLSLSLSSTGIDASYCKRKVLREEKKKNRVKREGDDVCSRNVEKTMRLQVFSKGDFKGEREKEKVNCF